MQKMFHLVKFFKVALSPGQTRVFMYFAYGAAKVVDRSRLAEVLIISSEELIIRKVKCYICCNAIILSLLDTFYPLFIFIIIVLNIAFFYIPINIFVSSY